MKCIQVCYKYTYIKLKRGKYTFSLLFTYFSEMGFMYFSEIYLKLHLSVLDLYLEVYIYWSLCSLNQCFQCYTVGGASISPVIN